MRLFRNRYGFELFVGPWVARLDWGPGWFAWIEGQGPIVSVRPSMVDRLAVRLRTKLAREDRMLQVADLLTSGVHQRYRPSGNPIKQELSELVESLVKRTGAYGNRRIFPFEWKPGGIVVKKEG